MSNLLPLSTRRVAGQFWRTSDGFIEELSEALLGRRVLEIFGGNGYMAALLAQRGVDILSTSMRSGHDAHDLGFYHEVLDLEASDAVAEWGADRDVLLMCWPTVTPKALQACEAWRRQGDRDIVFIGEYTDYSRHILGGCATDEFFERFVPHTELQSYRGNMWERACIGRLVHAKVR